MTAHRFSFAEWVLAGDDGASPVLGSRPRMTEGGFGLAASRRHRESNINRRVRTRQEDGPASTSSNAGKWCPPPESNRHSRRNGILNPARLPIPPEGPVEASCFGSECRLAFRCRGRQAASDAHAASSFRGKGAPHQLRIRACRPMALRTTQGSGTG